VCDELIDTLSGVMFTYAQAIQRDAYFERLVRRVLQAVVASYLKAFVAKRPAWAINETKFFIRLARDREVIAAFFEQFADFIAEPTLLGTLGCLKQIETLLEVDDLLLKAHFPRFTEQLALLPMLDAKMMFEALMLAKNSVPKSRRRVLADFDVYIAGVRQRQAAAAALLRQHRPSRGASVTRAAAEAAAAAGGSSRQGARGGGNATTATAADAGGKKKWWQKFGKK
jgi:hypothetical protein